MPGVFNPQTINFYRPPLDSHKSQNGKLLVIGGSKLFHSSIFWSADTASRIVDLVHLTSPSNENNQIFRKRLKKKFWNGIVVDWKDVEEYIQEDDCVLIGPGMVRKLQNDSSTVFSRVASRRVSLSGHPIRLSSVDSSIGATDVRFPRKKINESLSGWGKEDKTDKIVNYLLKKYPTKKWVIDGGALQEVDPKLITESCILTPHGKEFEGLKERVIKRPGLFKKARPYQSLLEICANLSQMLKNCTILLKGPSDIACQGDRCVEIKGGNPGMTKGGTGDVLAGLVAALYTKNDPSTSLRTSSWTAAAMASYINKKAGDSLYKRIGPYFNAGDLISEIPLTIYGIMKTNV